MAKATCDCNVEMPDGTRKDVCVGDDLSDIHPDCLATMLRFGQAEESAAPPPRKPSAKPKQKDE